jgi:hypothetical protein
MPAYLPEIMNPIKRVRLDAGATPSHVTSHRHRAAPSGQLPEAIRAIVEALAWVQEELDHAVRLGSELAAT